MKKDCSTEGSMCCPCTGANVPRFALTLAAGFVFVFIYEYILHGNILMETYSETPHLWRTMEDMGAHAPFMFLHQFLLVLMTAFIFTRNFEGKGVKEGLRYGVMIGLLLAVMMSGSYAWMPISGSLAIAWAIGGLIQGIGLGVIYSLLYKA